MIRWTFFSPYVSLQMHLLPKEPTFLIDISFFQPQEAATEQNSSKGGEYQGTTFATTKNNNNFLT